MIGGPLQYIDEEWIAARYTYNWLALMELPPKALNGLSCYFDCT